MTKTVALIGNEHQKIFIAASGRPCYISRATAAGGVLAMDDAALVRHQYTYDQESGEWLWRNPPAKAAFAKAAPGTPAGTIDDRDGTRLLKLGKRICRSSRLAWLYVYGEWPSSQVLYRDPLLPVPSRDAMNNLRLAGTDEELTQERVHQLLDYNDETGELRWRTSRKGIRAGDLAAGVKNVRARSAYMYVRINGVDYPAQRLAWFYVKGVWPESRLAFADGDPKNIAINNLAESGFEYGTRQTPTISDEERRVRQAATFRRHDLKRDFGITVDEYQAKHDAQNGCCAICGCQESATRNGKIKWLAVDHDHHTGALRDLLCAACNQGLGNFRDDPAVLRAAAAYIERHAAESDAA